LGQVFRFYVEAFGNFSQLGEAVVRECDVRVLIEARRFSPETNSSLLTAGLSSGRAKLLPTIVHSKGTAAA
jgi:hypothetical protein